MAVPGPSRRFARLATTTAAFTVTLFSVGGLVRGTGSGLGCSTWPKCGPDRWLPYPNVESIIEYAHRGVAAVVVVLILLQALSAWRNHRNERLALSASLLAVPLVFGQAALGGVVVLVELNPWWVTVHFAVAMALVATVVVGAVAARRAGSSGEEIAPPGFATLARVTAATTLLLLLVGTFVRATDSGLAFRDWPLMDGRLIPALGGAATAMFLHRVVAAAAFLLVLWTFIRAMVQPRSRTLALLSGTVFALMIGQVLVGAAQVWTLLTPWTVALHVAMSAAIWALLVALAVVASDMPVAESSAMTTSEDRSTPSAADRLMAYVRLTKPRIIVLLLITTVPAMMLAQRGLPPLGLILATLLGGAVSAGAANAVNCYLDRDIDEIMRRTRKRPLPAHQLPPERALAFGYVLAAAAFFFLSITVNVLAAGLALSAVFFYVFIYTLWLKRTSVQNIVIGGAAGAIPALVGWAAVTGGVGLPAWILFAIIFMWTPPHFWALAMRYEKDYAAAGVPMLPVVKGGAETRRQILIYSLLLVATSLLLAPVAGTGMLYLVPALGLGAVFLYRAFRLWIEAEAGDPMRLFRYSLTYLAALFGAVALDSVISLGRLA